MGKVPSRGGHHVAETDSTSDQFIVHLLGFLLWHSPALTHNSVPAMVQGKSSVLKRWLVTEKRLGSSSCLAFDWVIKVYLPVFNRTATSRPKSLCFSTSYYVFEPCGHRQSRFVGILLNKIQHFVLQLLKMIPATNTWTCSASQRIAYRATPRK